MFRKLAVLLSLGAVLAIGAVPALADPSACVTTNITVNDTPLPTNGTTCVP